MAFKGWSSVSLRSDANEEVQAIAPLIISASRATDIPGFYADWLMKRMEKGYVRWVNPFNMQAQFVSFELARLFVFWTKNPAPLMPHLDVFDRRGINYYFQFTLNDYGRLEPNVPSLEKRIETFKSLSKRLGKERVIWRFDPLILADNLAVSDLVQKIRTVGDQVHAFTDKLVISFADIDTYKKVRDNLNRKQIVWRNFNPYEKMELAAALAELNRNWGLEIATCAEDDNLLQHGITHNRCIDDRLMIKAFSQDKVLMDFLGYQPEAQGSLFGSEPVEDKNALKDKGQRQACGCIVSKDIGQYNTCGHFCEYCYANGSQDFVRSCMQRAGRGADTIISD